MKQKATGNIIQAATKGASKRIVAASEVRRATEAAEANDSEQRAELAADPKVKTLADCLADADDAQAVDECMVEYCDSDVECIVDYADNSCSEEDTGDEAPRVGFLRRVFSRFSLRRGRS